MQENLFIQPVGVDGKWMRYHHLFRDFLQAQIEREEPLEPARILRQMGVVYSLREDWERAYEIYQRLGDYQAIADLIELARTPLMLDGRWRTLAEWIDALPNDTLNLRPGLVSARGIVAVMLGDISHGLALLNQAVDILQTTQNHYELAYAHERRAYAHLFSGDYQSALKDAELALSLAEDDETLKIVKAEAFKVIAQCMNHTGNVDAILSALISAGQMFSELNRLDDLAIVNTRLGEVYRIIGKYNDSHSTYNNAIIHFQKIGNIAHLALLLNNAGVAYHTTGDYQQASLYFEESSTYARQSGYKYAEACVLASIGDFYADLDAPDAAQRAYQDAYDIAEKIANRFLIFYLAFAETILSCRQDNLVRARASLQLARSITENSNSAYEKALYLLAAGRLAMAEEEVDQAQENFSQAVELFENGRQKVEAVRARFYLAMASNKAGKVDTAIKELKSAFRAASELESQQILVVAGREAKLLIQTAQDFPAIGSKASQLLQEIDQFEASIPALRRQLRKQISTVPFAPPHLTIKAFGEGDVLINGIPASGSDWISRKPVRDLFFCLLAHPQGLNKEEIGAIFWPESSSFRLKLRFKNLIYWLRHALGQDVIVFEEKIYRFNPSLDYEYDVETFHQRINQAQLASDPHQQTIAYQDAVRLYQGDYLIYTDQYWAALERENLRQAFLDAGLKLGQLLLDMQNYQDTLTTCQQLLADDPCLEPAHRLAMRAYAAQGNRAAIARQFENCRRSLLVEIDLPPSEETRHLHDILMR